MVSSQPDTNDEFTVSNKLKKAWIRRKKYEATLIKKIKTELVTNTLNGRVNVIDMR